MTDEPKAIVDHVFMFIRGTDATARTRYETLMTSVGACLLKLEAAAGTGKSFTINTVIARCQAEVCGNCNDRYCITASHFR